MSEFVVHGAAEIDLAAVEHRQVSLVVVSGGCSILFGNSREDAQLVYSGTGRAAVKFAGAGSRVFFLPYQKDGVITVSIPELREAEPGWTDEPSLTDLSPRPFGQISPEIRAVMDHMNRNAIIREQALLRALGRRDSGPLA